MPLQVFLNELSLPQAACAQEVAIDYLKGFVGAVRAASQISAQFVLNTREPLANLNFGPDWPLAVLRNVAGCSDESTYLKTVQDRAPHGQTIAELGGPAEEEFEYRLCGDAAVMAGELATSLGLANYYDGLSVSIETHNYWASSKILLDCTRLIQDGGLSEARVTTLNATTAKNVLSHQEALRRGLRPVVANGLELWDQRAVLFPNLHFIPRTRQQLEQLQEGDPVLVAVVDRLTGIDRAIDQWRRLKLAHPIYPFNVRPESRTRVKLTKFKDDDGVTRTFSDHADFAPGEGRVHFILETEPVRRALVGHVDRKLGIG